MRTSGWTYTGIAIFVASILGMLSAGYTSVAVAGEGAINVSVIGNALAAIVGLVLIRAVPPRLSQEFGSVSKRQLVVQGWSLLGIALAVPVAFAALVTAVPSDWQLFYPFLKVLLFFLLPLAILWGTGGIKIPIRGSSRLWYWLGPIPAIIGYLLIEKLGPFSADLITQTSIEPEVLIITVVITFLTASVGEELFYRWMLQTRLELWLGQWPGILIASILFALMHLPTRWIILGGSGSVIEDFFVTTAAVIAIQGTFGLVAGYLWSRYRNIWLTVALHAGLNHVSLLWLL